MTSLTRRAHTTMRRRDFGPFGLYVPRGKSVRRGRRGSRRAGGGGRRVGGGSIRVAFEFMPLGGSSRASGADDGVRHPLEESTGSQVGQCFYYGAEGGVQPCVQTKVRGTGATRREWENGRSQSTTTSGGKGKPPTHAKVPKRNKMSTRRARSRKKRHVRNWERGGGGGGRRKTSATHGYRRRCRISPCESAWTTQGWRKSGPSRTPG